MCQRKEAGNIKEPTVRLKDVVTQYPAIERTAAEEIEQTSLRDYVKLTVSAVELKAKSRLFSCYLAISVFFVVDRSFFKQLIPINRDCDLSITPFFWRLYYAATRCFAQLCRALPRILWREHHPS